VVELTDDTDDPAIWGKNFPLQYDSYRRTVDQVRTRYGGSEALPRTPTDADPRSVVAQSKLEEDPRLIAMWAGYAFALDFREERGHAYMLEDQTFTGRQQRPQPGSCLNCHASTYLAYKKAGDGDIIKGFEKINALAYAEARPLVEHPVACIDCHTADTLALRITRPAFIEGIRALKASQGVPDFDVNRDATRQECDPMSVRNAMSSITSRAPRNGWSIPGPKASRSRKSWPTMTRWTTRIGNMPRPGAPALKAQHPEFEMWSQGIHSRSGVACADCHMPYHRVGAHKVSDHHVRSPLLNINNACQTCHKWPEQELLARVETIQGRTAALRDLAMDALIDLIEDHEECPGCRGTGGSNRQAQDYQRKAQFYLDFVEAENSMGFHAPRKAPGFSPNRSTSADWVSIGGQIAACAARISSTHSGTSAGVGGRRFTSRPMLAPKTGRQRRIWRRSSLPEPSNGKSRHAKNWLSPGNPQIRHISAAQLFQTVGSRSAASVWRTTSFSPFLFVG
jgi:nitrite reductase (cytochrome c-552)